MVAKIKQSLGPMWCSVALIFIAQRLGDIVNIATGLWLVPKYVPEAEWGAVLALALVGGVLVTEVKVSAGCPGLLVFDDQKTDNQEILVDEKSARPYVVDALWPAVLVPAGEYDVVLRHTRKQASLLLSFLTSVVALGWSDVLLVSKCGRVAGDVA
ncbi:MAG: hypothetical protein PHX41_05190 [Kiritimatiellae bacterium]|nr:hypothetical protein [Kiritimatiellia bacterium]